jgi:ankyrin repeat protein
MSAFRGSVLIFAALTLFANAIPAEDILTLAASGTAPEIQELLRNRTNLQTRDASGATPLIRAARSNPNANVIQLLLDAGARKEDADAVGQTALMHAILGDNRDAITILVTKGADINTRDRAGHTALMNAAALGRLQLVSLLLKSGSRPNDADRFGQTALMYACLRNKGTEIVSLLLQAGANVNGRDIDGMTPLLHSVQRNPAVAGLVLVLLNAGADVRAKNKEGKTAFDMASLNHHLDGTEAYRRLKSVP